MADNLLTLFEVLHKLATAPRKAVQFQ